MKQILVFSEKPKYKIGDRITEVTANNGHFKFYIPYIVYKIIKNKSEYKVYIEEKY